MSPDRRTQGGSRRNRRKKSNLRPSSRSPDPKLVPDTERARDEVEKRYSQCEHGKDSPPYSKCHCAKSAELLQASPKDDYRMIRRTEQRMKHRCAKKSHEHSDNSKEVPAGRS